MDSLETQIERLYHAAFNRSSDASGLAYWVNSGWPLSQIAAFFAASPELMARYGALSDDGYVRQLYQNILGRPGEQAGITYWDNALAGGFERGSILNAFAQSPENIVHIATPVVVTTPPPVTDPPPVTLPPPPVGTPPTVPPVDIPGNINIPTLSVTGFMTADTIANVDHLIVGSDPDGPSRGLNGNLVVGSLVNVGDVTAMGNVGSAHTVPFTRIEVQAGYGNTAFNLTGAFGPTVVLDHVGPTSLGNAITFGSRGGTLEIGDFAFDGARYGGTTVTLTEHGSAVYSLNHVAGASGLTVGHNNTSGHDFIVVPSSG